VYCPGVPGSLFPDGRHASARLRQLLEDGSLVIAPGCYDALSARVIERSGHSAAFISGFAVAGSRLGLPDVGLMSYGEAVDQARLICAATSLPVIGDADTGYGNAVNAQRTLLGFAQAGVACVMVEDQQSPKQCGHTTGKEVVGRVEAVARVRAMIEARSEHGLDVLIMARTDAVAAESFDEALWRASAFADQGADLTFIEAPENRKQMERYCAGVPGWKTANLVEDGRTPWLEPNELSELGYSLAIYPLSLMLRSISAMESAADRIGRSDEETRVKFDHARDLVGWPDYEMRVSHLERGVT
jgi:2-methylisocitrate lyase-like PEP mutase family enzyme